MGKSAYADLPGGSRLLQHTAAACNWLQGDPSPQVSALTACTHRDMHTDT